jgi:hypothetical protein
MTGKTLRQNLYLTISALLIASAITLWLGVRCGSFSEASRSIIPVYIAIAAGWLTFCLQRRVAYTNALRSLWERMVDTIQSAVQYTQVPTRAELEFWELNQQLNCRIDEVRGVFRNVGEAYQAPSAETGAFVRSIKHAATIEAMTVVVGGYEQTGRRGVYPFESLKQIQGMIARLGFGPNATAKRAAVARSAILQLWGILSKRCSQTTVVVDVGSGCRI